MTSTLLVVVVLVAQIYPGGCESSPFLDKNEANDFLRRIRRSNHLFEEFSQGNMERECIEEVCNQEEAYEVFDEQTTKAREFWNKYLRCKQSQVLESAKLSSLPLDEEEPRIRFARQVTNREWKNQLMRECIADTDQCNPFPCISSNTEECVDETNAYTCVCKQGFTGRRCESPVNECLSNPCGNFGTCEDEIGGFRCVCDSKHEGVRCEKEIKDCRIWGCGHGQCGPGEPGEDYACGCYPGYTGNTCDEDINECATNPCDQTCTNEVGGFQCSCRAGYLLDLATQTKCEDIDECRATSHGCEHYCVNSVGGFQCQCKSGYALDALYSRYCEDIDECLENNGNCPIIESGCGLDRGPCKTCNNIDGEFFCSCPSGFYRYQPGEVCEDIDECESGPGRACAHTCENYPGGYRCLCRDGFKMGFDRKTCIDINECIRDHGCDYRCTNSPGSYKCTCQRGYVLMEDGKGCGDLDECAAENECKHLCMNTDGSYQCSCRPGYRPSGKYRCYDINECLTSPCGLNGRCVNEDPGFRCECNEGYSGDLCEVGAAPCESHPCQNGGVCLAENSGFLCECSMGFTGELCQEAIRIKCNAGFVSDGNGCIDINECHDGPCGSHSCMNTNGSYICDCDSGFILVNNECQDVDECSDLITCQTCHNLPGSFRCECSDGYELKADGKTCERMSVCTEVSFSTVNDYILLGTEKNDFVEQGITDVSRKFAIEFQFRTFDRDGVIMALTDLQPGRMRYLYVVERSGKLYFGSNLGGSHVENEDAKSEGHSNANGQWHQIVIRRRNTRIRIVHDGRKLPQMQATMAEFAATRVFYGGLPDSIIIPDISVHPDAVLQGCFRNIHYTGLRLSSTSAIDESHSGCFENIENGTYFDGTGYLLQDANLGAAFRLRFTFRSFSGRGRLVTIEDENGHGFALDVAENQVIAKLRYASGEIFTSIYTKPGDEMLCDNIWHVCDASVSQSKIALHVDGLGAQEKDIAGMHSVTFGQNQLFYLGGYKDPAVTPFHGSLRGLKLDNKPVDLQTYIGMAGVRTHSSPVV